MFIQAGRSFDFDFWNKMVIEAAESRNPGREHKNICRVIYPNGFFKLELKTNQEVIDHLQRYGAWNANCGKMPLREVLNITRISSLVTSIPLQEKTLIKDSLARFAEIAEKKYNSGFTGLVRKVISIFFNLFTQNHVSLFCLDHRNKVVLKLKDTVANKLPWFIGNDAEFANLINKTRFS